MVSARLLKAGLKIIYVCDASVKEANGSGKPVDAR